MLRNRYIEDRERRRLGAQRREPCGPCIVLRDPAGNQLRPRIAALRTGRCIQFGQLAQGCIQPNVETRTTRLGRSLLERRALVAVLLRCQLRWRTYHHSQGLHSTTKKPALTGLYPRPKGRGFTPERVTATFFPHRASCKSATSRPLHSTSRRHCFGRSRPLRENPMNRQQAQKPASSRFPSPAIAVSCPSSR